MLQQYYSGPQFAPYTAGSTAHDVLGFGNTTVVDKVPPELLFLVDSHWYQFPPLSPFYHKFMFMMMLMIWILAIPGNGMVVYIFTTTKSLRTPSNLLITNLSFSEFCMMFCMAPTIMYNSWNETWSLGPLGCQLYGFVGSLFGNTSIWTMTMIALDRYNVIVKGIAAKPMTVGTALVRILFIWIHGLFWTLAPLFGWNRYVPEGNMTACGTDYLTRTWFSRSYILTYSVFVYFLPLFTIVWAYYYIVMTVMEHEKGMREQAKKMNVTSLRSGDEGSTRTEFKLAKVALMTISLWFMAWTPYLIINYAAIFEAVSISPMISVLGGVFAKANAIYNPIVYAISHPKYRAALNEKVPCFKACGSPEDTTSATTATTK